MNEKLKFNIEELKRLFDITFEEICRQENEMAEYVNYTESLEEEFSEMRAERQKLLDRIVELEDIIEESRDE